LLRLTAQHSAARSAQEAHGVPVDLQALLILLDGDLELLRELTSDFIALGNASLATLADSLQSDDRDSIAATAHALKGASANLRARHEPAQGLQQLSGRLHEELHRAFDYLSREVA
jgi:HPt (histidine-containing phosphotransfer) domain-containing protein